MLESVVQDLISSGRAAETGLMIDAAGGMLPGSLTTLLSDMSREISASITELELAPADEGDALYRADALTSARGTLEAVRLAQYGHTSAAIEELDIWLAELSGLEDEQ